MKQGDNKVQALLFDIRRSWRYHEHRVKFFRRFSVLRLILASLSTSAVFSISLVALDEAWEIGDWILPLISALSVFLVTSDGAIHFGDKERLHERLTRAFKMLERDIIVKGDISEDELRVFWGTYHEIELDEPPILHTLNDLCHNAEVTARFPANRREKLMVEIHPFKRALASFYDLMPSTYNLDRQKNPSSTG